MSLRYPLTARAQSPSEHPFGPLFQDVVALAVRSKPWDFAQLPEVFRSAMGSAGFQVVIDYLWGMPAEAFLTAITRTVCRHSIGDQIRSGR